MVTFSILCPLSTDKHVGFDDGRSVKHDYFIFLTCEKLLLVKEASVNLGDFGCIPLGWYGSGLVIQDHSDLGTSKVEQRVHSGHGFICFFDALWSKEFNACFCYIHLLNSQIQIQCNKPWFSTVGSDWTSLRSWSSGVNCIHTGFKLQADGALPCSTFLFLFVRKIMETKFMVKL